MLELGSDEVVLDRADGVSLRLENESGKGSSSHIGELTLTNKRINFVYTTGIIKRTEKSIDVPLEDIKLFDGVAQCKPLSKKDDRLTVYLSVYLPNNEYKFEFSSRDKKKVLALANTVNKVITGVDDCWTIESLGGKRISKSIRGAIGTAAPIVSELADAAKPLAPIADAVTGKKASVASGILGSVADAFVKTRGSSADPVLSKSNEDEKASPDTSSISLDEQIEAVQKLKELCDAGVLTDEEFQLKKKQIMGL